MVFYFSGTGNSQWAAGIVAEAVGEQLVYIPDFIGSSCHFELKPEERIGFVFPIHGWRPPQLVLKFIDKLDIESEGHYCYALVTAGDNIGLAMNWLAAALDKKGMHVDSAFSLIMPESYVGLPFMDVDTEEKEREKKKKAKADLNRFVGHIVNRDKGVSELMLGPLPSFFSGPVGGFFVKYLITDKPFHVIQSKCIKCGRCEEVCPVDDIILDKETKFPHWQHNGECLTCFSCYHHCPVKAIEYGCKTKYKGQYYFTKKKSPEKK